MSNIRTSEKFNQKAKEIDNLLTIEIINIINEVDQEIPGIVKKVLPQLEKLIDKAVMTLKQKGRIIYMGSGHSGDMCHGDAQETAVTFGIPFGTFRGLHLQLGPNWDWEQVKKVDISNRDPREDGKTQFIDDLKDINWTKNDLVIGVSASGGTPVTIEALKWVQAQGGTTACIVNNIDSPMAQVSDIVVEGNAGPEIVSGSTRMKSGTVTKMLMNMLSTATMIHMGNVYKGLMVGLLIGPKNDLQKFEERAKRIVEEATGVDSQQAEKLLDDSDNTTANGSQRSIKVAIIMHEMNCDAAEAKILLEKNHGNIRAVINDK